MRSSGLEDKVVVITGGGSGMGLASAQAFAQEGARVVVGDLTPPPADAIEARVPPLLEVVDFRDPQGAETLIAKAVDAFGGVDVLVNNVGIGWHRDGLLSVSDEDWRGVLDVNFMTVVRATRAAVPHMVERGGGSIVCIASDVARQPDPFLVDYCVSKAAVLSLSKAISIEFGAQGIRCNCVSPGPTETPMMSGFLDSLAADLGIPRAEASRHFAVEMRKLPLGRMNQPEDVANMVVFLAGDLASQVTGADYRVDAGAVISV